MTSSLESIKNNHIISFLLKKPSFLLVKDEELLLHYIKNRDFKKFYEKAGSIIKNSREITHLYTYLSSKAQAQGFLSDELKNHLAWRLFNNSSVGWLQVRDPEILKYCKENTNDKDLLKELARFEKKSWYNDYLPYLRIESSLTTSFSYKENAIKEYILFLKELLKKEEISKEDYFEIIKRLQKETSLYKGESLIGSLLSKTLQEYCGFSIIAPKITIAKDGKNILIEK